LAKTLQQLRSAVGSSEDGDDALEVFTFE
jgi:hypothetical protein